jgi:chemotaxis protein CheX
MQSTEVPETWGRKHADCFFITPNINGVYVMAKRAKNQKDAANKQGKKDNKDTGDGAIAVVKLPDILDMAASDDLHKLISSTISPVSDIEIDAGDVERLSSPCAQILVATHQHQEQNGHQIRIKNMSDQFRETMNLLGLGEQLDKWSTS